MSAVRISVSDIDSYRYWRDDEPTEYAEAMSLDTLLARLRRQVPPSDEMRAGSALHAMLEHAVPCDLDAVEYDGHRFLFECDGEISLPPLRERKYVKRYVIDGIEVDLVGKVDGEDGVEVRDYKTTGRIDPEHLLDTYQWRHYLNMSGAQRFRWIVFKMAYRERKAAWVISEVQEIIQHRYPALAADCEESLREYVHFLKLHLPEKL